MKVRLIAASGIVLTLVLVASVSAAKPKAVPCQIVADTANDAVAVVPGGSSPSSLEIVSGDVVADGKELTAVVRLKAFTDPDPNAPVSRKYFFIFTAAGHEKPLYLATALGWEKAEGPTVEFGFVDGATFKSYGGSPARGVVETARAEIRMSIPVSALVDKGAKIKAKAKLTNLRIMTVAYFVPFEQGPGSVADEATGKASYVVGSPSCVRIGV